LIINKFIIIATDNKVECLSNQFGEFLESFKSLSEQLTNRTNNDNTDLVTEDLKKSLKDSIRRNLFIHDKYPTDLKIEKYCKESLSKTYPQNQNYIDRHLWDGVWFKLRQPVYTSGKWVQILCVYNTQLQGLSI